MICSREDVVQRLRDCEAERDERKNEVESMINSRDGIIQSLQDREAERDEATRELERIYDEIRDLNNNKSVKESELREELSELKAQNIQLKHLLASVNESEERLRNTVMVAENSLRMKTQELKDSQHRITQIEQELSKSQLADAELARIEQTKADLFVSVERLQREKKDVERLLQEERNARNKLHKQMGEEQRALIQEGENMTTDLRKKLKEFETKLNQSESEAYTARKQVEEINDERNRLEERYVEASTQLASSDSSKERQEEQITALRSQLNDAKSESYALKESAIDMKEKMRRATRDSEKAMRESEIGNSELSAIRRKLLSLENLNETNQTEIAKLRKRLKEAGENENAIVTLRKELESKKSEISVLKLEIGKESKTTHVIDQMNNQNEIRNLKSELERLNEIMEQKDARIQKLELSKFTKLQMNEIKRIKTEQVKYKKKCSTLQNEINRLQIQISSTGAETDVSSQIRAYVKKCSHLEKEINRLQKLMSSMGSETKIGSEISELRFDKEALEKKLRKFATHCQRLEDDKAGMVDALQSCNINIHGSDVSEAIVHLCDKLASIEEAHEKQLNNASSEEEKHLMQRKIENLSHLEKRLTEKLNQYQQENAELQEKLGKTVNESSAGDSEEHREKIRYLEHENLQLMHDMKSVKRQLQASREEIETLRMNSIDQTPTAEFECLDVRAASAKHILSPVTSSSKENSDTMELANLAEACTKNILRLSARKTKKRNILSDSTNGIRDEGRGERIIDKRQKVGGLAGKKTMNRNPVNHISTPGLGETSSNDTENGGECKQS